jgi:hypothetical protein
VLVDVWMMVAGDSESVVAAATPAKLAAEVVVQAVGETRIDSVWV